MAIALGIDFEHIQQTPAYRSIQNPAPIEIDIPKTTTEILDLFESYDVVATFFIVSELATEYPDLIREIDARGHEIASHTRTHQSVVDCDDSRQYAEIAESKAELESIVGHTITGFRAPTCRIDDDVFRLLLENDYEYSSSIMPGVPIPGFYSNEYDFDGPREISDGEDNLTELPLSINPFVRLPVSGAWIRLLGQRYTLTSIQQLLNRERDVITYSHPWEVFPLQDTQLPFKNRLRTGEWFRDTYERMLQFDVKYCSVSELAERTTPDEKYILN